MKRFPIPILAFGALICLVVIVYAWTPLPISDDPLVRMPGTQPDQGVKLEAPGRCLNCHSGYNSQVEPGTNWKGSMMSQAARDFLFWSCLTVAAQDSIWAVGRPNAVDICERCHFPQGWLEGRSDPPNASAMTGADFDGVQCDSCHTMYDPFFEGTFQGTREGSDWLSYWDETNSSDTPSQTAANATYQEDQALAQAIELFNGNAFYQGNFPFNSNYTENAGGQYFVSTNSQKRASFADADARHQMFYNRYHKSKFFCSACHDVSNPVLANLSFNGTPPGDGTTILPSESSSAYSYYHVERTFSEFMLSSYGQQGGAPGLGPFAPGIFETSLPTNYIARCQDCHLRDVIGVACNKQGVPIRPNESIEHPNSGLPLHDMTGGNLWVSYVLASAIAGSSNYDATNASLLNQGSGVLTLDLSEGEGINPAALLAGVDRVEQQLQHAASIQNLSYDASNGSLSFRIQNQTGHKLISGFPEGRRMFVNIRAYTGGSLIYEVNPYGAAVGTLKGLDPNYSPSSPPLGTNETYIDELVYEMHPKSTLTGEAKTFHFALATDRYKDNRIPPKGFRIADAGTRLSEPVWQGVSAPGYFMAAEYAGGYDDVSLTIATGADQVDVNLYYQTTSREYVEFLRDEIKGTSNLTLPASAYIIQTDPFFEKLKAWGDTIWQLWTHNMNVPGAAPFLMTSATATAAATPTPTTAPTPSPTLTVTPTQTPTGTLTMTPTPTPTQSPTPGPTSSPSPTPEETPIATPTDTPGPTPTDTPLPTPTTTASPTPWHKNFDFTSGTEGWTTVTVPLAFAEPDFIFEPDYVKIIALNNTNCFGYWQSPADAVPAESGYLYRARFSISTNVTDQSLVPQIRLRANSSNLQQSDYITIESSGDGGASPLPSGTTYDLYFVPPANDTSAALAFDLMNFSPTDAPNAELSLDSVIVNRFLLNSLTTPTIVQTYNFYTDTQDWTTGGAPIVFTPPIYMHSDDALQLQATTNTDTFGYWQSNATDITIEASRLYRGNFNVRTDITDKSRVPQMRLRFNTENLQASRTLGIESIGNGANSPGTSDTIYNNLYFLPPANCVGGGLIVSFDILNFSPDDAAEGSLILDSATIETLSPPVSP